MSTFAQRMQDIMRPNIEVHDGSTPHASRQALPELTSQDSTSQLGGLPFLTPSLLPAYIPPAWSYDGNQYEHLENVIRQSAPSEVPDNIREWVIIIMKSLVDNELKKMYNVLKRRLKEVILKSENEKLSDKIRAQDTHMVILNDEITSTQGAMLDMGKKMMELGSEYTELHHELASLKASGVTMMQGHTSGMVQLHKLHIKIVEPPHYSGKGSLEDWLQQLSIWMRWNEINDNERKITTALLHLEGGAFTYMSEYMTKAAAWQALGTWENFVDILKVNYRTLDPDKNAQQHLKKICAKTYLTMVSFAEKFHQWATKTNLGHTALIGYIAEHRDKDICQAMSKFRANKAGQHGTTTASSSQAPRARKDPNAMDVDHVSQLTKEQEGWLERKLCVHCGKHPFIFKQHCLDPKYKGKLKMLRWGQVTRAVITPVASTSFDNSKVREEAVQAFLASYDAKDKEAEPEPAIEAARITKVESDEDFLRRVL
ncbi:uncharacterized protein LAESUDRAFT_761861 [Laetiporus sulphureus 93-53]|uniref:Retrotransposon gag domain-containing protein n=1 Tax=Laetiporus sulphureus 93-53 TaxID=1314785 RepID=A0A165CVM0_9APHY|nr:uncharacterized protein LAESUDRAFT_761861 [Laetiporus sulphureus 93-53]KZT03509.1 hypothetical protein LAESUDRAFT_761861 [Laetiporus sulphureus 93-53]